MPVMHLLAHGDLERDTQAFDEIPLLIAIEDETVYEADLFLARIKIQAHGEGKPCAIAFDGFVKAFHFDDGTHGTALFYGDALKIAQIIVEAERSVVSGAVAVFGGADEPGLARDFAAIPADGADEIRAALRNVALHRAGVDNDLGGGLR